MKVKCVDCRLSEWQRTPTGRIKANACGRCLADIPEPLKIMSAISNDKPRKCGIWPEMSGECDLYEAKI